MAELMAAGLNNLPLCRIYNGKLYDGATEIAKILPEKIFRSLLKHFRFASPVGLPKKGEEGWHPLQNIMKGIAFLKKQSLLLWRAGMCNS